MKIIDVFLRRGIVYLHPMSQTTVGAWIPSPPYLSVSWNEKDSGQRLNKAVAEVLIGSQQGVPHPEDWDTISREPLFPLAGVKLWRDFLGAGCKLVAVESRDDGVYLIPQENRGMKGGFVDCAEPILCTPRDLSDWKTLLATAFKLCK